MKTAIITGTSSGIGKETAKAFLSKKYSVIGFSRTPSGIVGHSFTELICDLTDTALLEKNIRRILVNSDIDLLINNAGAGYYGPHEQISPSMIHEMVTVNLEVPMLLSSLLLRSLKKTHGTIINVSSVTAHKTDNTHGVSYGATKAGLTSFGASLFAEVRKYGVRVVNIHPDMTDTNLYRNADFGVDCEKGCCLSAGDVAEVIVYAADAPEGMNLSDITISPQFHRIMRKKMQEMP